MSYFDDADIIHVYTRRQAIEDGTLVDVSDSTAYKESGLLYPVALTRSVWSLVEATPEEESVGQSMTGRLWDLLWMLKIAWKRKGDVHAGEHVPFECIFLVCRDRAGETRGRQRTESLVFAIGGGDNGEPCITIMYPHED